MGHSRFSNVIINNPREPPVVNSAALSYFIGCQKFGSAEQWTLTLQTVEKMRSEDDSYMDLLKLAVGILYHILLLVQAEYSVT